MFHDQNIMGKTALVYATSFALATRWLLACFKFLNEFVWSKEFIWYVPCLALWTIYLWTWIYLPFVDNVWRHVMCCHLSMCAAECCCVAIVVPEDGIEWDSAARVLWAGRELCSRSLTTITDSSFLFFFPDRSILGKCRSCVCLTSPRIAHFKLHCLLPFMHWVVPEIPHYKAL